MPRWLGGAPSPSLQRCHHTVAGNRCHGHPFLALSKQTNGKRHQILRDGRLAGVDYNSLQTNARFDGSGPTTVAGWRRAYHLACGAWHAEEHTVKPRAEKGISHRACFRSYQTYDLQFRGAIHSFPPCHPSPLPTSDHPLSLLASFLRLNPSVLFFLSSSRLPRSSLFLTLRPCQRRCMAPWRWCGALFLHHFLSYSHRPLCPCPCPPPLKP